MCLSNIVLLFSLILSNLANCSLFSRVQGKKKILKCVISVLLSWQLQSQDQFSAQPTDTKLSASTLNGTDEFKIKSLVMLDMPSSSSAFQEPAPASENKNLCRQFSWGSRNPDPKLKDGIANMLKQIEPK